MKLFFDCLNESPHQHSAFSRRSVIQRLSFESQSNPTNMNTKSILPALLILSGSTTHSEISIKLPDKN
jgi:hypothetical protein